MCNTSNAGSGQELKVVIKRATPRKLTPQLDYDDGPATEVEVPGSPFAFRLFRRNAGYMRNEAAPGTTTVSKVRVLSLLNALDGAVRDGDIAYIPACRASDGVPLRARLNQPRPYPNGGIQCDLETGNQQVDTPRR